MEVREVITGTDADGNPVVAVENADEIAAARTALYAPLKTEIAGAAYAGKTDAEIAAMVNAKTAPARRMIQVADVQKFFARNGLLVPLAAYVGNAANAGALRDVCAVAQNLLGFAGGVPVFTEFDLDDANDKAAIDGFTGAFVQAEVMTADQVTALYALADTTVPWTQANGLPTPINEHDVVLARAS